MRTAAALFYVFAKTLMSNFIKDCRMLLSVPSVKFCDFLFWLKIGHHTDTQLEKGGVY